MRQFTDADILHGREVQYPLTGALDANRLDLLDALNALSAAYTLSIGRELPGINSGYRPGHYNVEAGGAPHSTHLYCMAVDIADADGAVDAWVQEHLAEVIEMGFVGIENPSKTPGWCHLDMKQRYDAHGRPLHVFT